jgi:hypothetical protein
MGWTSILSAVLQIGLPIITFFFDKAKVSAEMRQRFLDWVKFAAADLGSTKLMAAGDRQIAWMKAQGAWKETT